MDPRRCSTPFKSNLRPLCHTNNKYPSLLLLPLEERPHCFFLYLKILTPFPSFVVVRKQTHSHNGGSFNLSSGDTLFRILERFSAANDLLLGTLDQLRQRHCHETRVKIVYSWKGEGRALAPVSRVTNWATVNRTERAQKNLWPFESKICNPLFSQQARGTPGSSFCGTRHPPLEANQQPLKGEFTLRPRRVFSLELASISKWFVTDRAKKSFPLFQTEFFPEINLL